MNDDRKTHLSSRRAGGFTLIELMVTMAIMATLTAAMAYVMAGAQEAAQIAKTRSLIARLHTLVMQKYETYRSRRLPVSIPGVVIDPANGNKIQTPLLAVQKMRCDVIRQLMRLEMPERWTDILDEPVFLILSDPTGKTYKDVSNPSSPAGVQMNRPACSQAYLAFFNSINVAQNTTFQQAPSHFQGAKCLYLLVTMGLEDTDVMENFSEGDIADFDKTGCKVFLDAWGHPIEFLRWAPGFVSSLQPVEPGTNGVPNTVKDLRMPDQTDPTGVYGVPRNQSTHVNGKDDTFALYPLIYSAGPDGNYDTVTGTVHSGPMSTCEEVLKPSGVVVFSYSKAFPPNNPFFSVRGVLFDFKDGPIGASMVYPTSDRSSRAVGGSDNIHNHTIGAR
jgi:prepilin-type N-terminal cleavage/methylation domain-containing protein